MSETIINSFNINDNLNTKIWDVSDDVDEITMKPEIRAKLLQIAKRFIDFIDIENLTIEDVTLTGSLANYNWSRYSDIDLHILLDYSIISDDVEFVENFLNAKKSLFNLKHDISIKNFEVELYAQNSTEEHHSTGVYSVLYDRWGVQPIKDSFTIDKESVKEKVKKFIRDIDDIERDYKNNPEDENLIKRIEKLKDKIGKYRKIGLSSNAGESSVENIVFKYLRRGGYFELLSDIVYDVINKQLTVEKY